MYFVFDRILEPSLGVAVMQGNVGQDMVFLTTVHKDSFKCGRASRACEDFVVASTC
jgi:hypothetical protein